MISTCMVTDISQNKGRFNPQLQAYCLEDYNTLSNNHSDKNVNYQKCNRATIYFALLLNKRTPCTQ